MRHDVELLVFIAQKSGLHGTLHSSTASMARELGISQQSVSRKLRELEHQGLITRQAFASGISVSLSSSGVALLRAQVQELGKLFEKKPTQSMLRGTVCSGLGEGKYYLSFQQYQKQFQEKFSFTPYPGTLNLTVNPAERDAFLGALTPTYLHGFVTKERKFGGLNVYPVLFRGKNACLVVPDRTSHPKNLVELVSPDYLRKKFSLRDQVVVVVQERAVP